MFDINKIDEIIKKNQNIHYEIQNKIDVVRYDIPPTIDPFDYIKEEFENEGELIQFPIMDDNFGGFMVKQDGITFCFLNTYHPIIQQRYILAHEYYHFLDIKGKDEYFDGIFIDDADNSLNERKADYFATLLLLDENQVRQRFVNLKKQGYSFEEIVCKLMNIFKVPYKMMSIRLLEIGLIKESELIKNTMLDYGRVELLFDELGLDEFILDRTLTTKFGKIKMYLKSAKEEMLEEDYNNALKYYNNTLNRLNNTNIDLVINDIEETIKKISDDFSPAEQVKIRKIRELFQELKMGGA